MAAPAYTDFTIYSGTKLTNTDWNTNLQIIINYLTLGTADITVGDVVCTSITVGSSSITDLYPIGGMIEYGGDTAPTGWMICDGTAVSRTTYANLYAVIGTKYGIGDNSTTFNIPDLRDKFSIGKSATKALGTTGGTTTIATTHLPAHAHPITAVVTGGVSASHNHTVTIDNESAHIHSLPLTVNGGSGGVLNGSNQQGSSNTGAGSAHTHTNSVSTESADHTHTINSITDQTGGGTAYNQPYVSVNKIIKY